MVLELRTSSPTNIERKGIGLGLDHRSLRGTLPLKLLDIDLEVAEGRDMINRFLLFRTVMVFYAVKVARIEASHLQRKFDNSDEMISGIASLTRSFLTPCFHIAWQWYTGTLRWFACRG